jgi:hypothetical protein
LPAGGAGNPWGVTGRPRPLAALATALAGLVLAFGGCGGSGESSSASSPGAESPTRTSDQPRPCESRRPGRVADGVNDDQGGSTPGVDPCGGPGT